jgi:hypothetical protein
MSERRAKYYYFSGERRISQAIGEQKAVRKQRSAINCLNSMGYIPLFHRSRNFPLPLLRDLKPYLGNEDTKCFVFELSKAKEVEEWSNVSEDLTSRK